MKKISVVIAKRHSTSLTLEDEFYEELLRIAGQKKCGINELITKIDSERTIKNLSSAVRIYILTELKKEPGFMASHIHALEGIHISIG